MPAARGQTAKPRRQVQPRAEGVPGPAFEHFARLEERIERSEAEADALADLQAGLAPETEPVLRRALSKNPDDRFPTCATFIEALRTACDAKPDWRPLPAGASHTLPTVSTSGSGSSAAVESQETLPVASPPPPPVPIPPARKPRRLDDEAPEPEPEPEVIESAEPSFAEEAAPSGRGKKFAVVAAVLVSAGIAACYGKQCLDEPLQPATAPPAAPPPVAPPVTAPVAPPTAPQEQSTPQEQGAPQDQSTANSKPEEKQEPVGRPSPVDAPVETKPDPLPPRPPAPTERVLEIITTPPAARVEFDSKPSIQCNRP